MRHFSKPVSTLTFSNWLNVLIPNNSVANSEKAFPFENRPGKTLNNPPKIFQVVFTEHTNKEKCDACSRNEKPFSSKTTNKFWEICSCCHTERAMLSIFPESQIS